MALSAKLAVVIQTPDLEPAEEAHVELLQGGDEGSEGQQRSLEYDERRERYVATDLDPDTYLLRIRSEQYPEAQVERSVELESGENVVHEMIGPEEMHYYRTGDGERVYFQADENAMILSLGGQRARDVAERLVEEYDLESRDLLRDQAEDPIVGREPPDDEVRLLVDISEYADEREAFLAEFGEAFEDTLRREEVSGRLTAAMFRGGEPGEAETVEGLTDEIVVRFDGSVSEDRARKLADQYDCDQERSIEYAGNAYLWRYAGGPDYDILDVIDRIRGEAGVEYAEPNVAYQIELDQYTPNDFLYPEQPHFDVIDSPEGWDTLDDIAVNRRFGDPNITVGVFDLGVDPTHPDLTGNLTDGSSKLATAYDFTNMSTQTKANLGGAHGTKCASSAAAGTDGNVGGSGVAGNCSLIGARLPSSWTGLDMADAWIWGAGFPTGNPSFPSPPTDGADVISNSWGVTGGPLNDIIQDALDFLSTYGRNGRGCVVCFSIGNLGYKQFSSLRRYAAYDRTIAVGASINANPTDPVSSTHPDPNGNTSNLNASVDTRAFYSPYGPELDIVSPSHTSYLPGPGVADPIVSADVTGRGDWIGDDTTTTTLNADANSGDTTLDVADTSGFSAGDVVLLGSPGTANREFVGVTGVSGGQLQVDALGNNHTSGTAVATGPNDYSRDFGGTSHACPTVAGAAALILSVEPDLSWIQVRDILRSSADRIDLGQTNPKGQWVDNDGDGIEEFSQWYGYGRLNVEDAVTTAQAATPGDADAIVRDNLSDTGSVPSSGWHAHSPDIWVRQSDDPIPSLGYGSGPPHQNAKRGQDNYVYLRVKNRGSDPVSTLFLRALITHFPGIEFRYPQDWQPSTRPGAAVPSPLEPGSYLIGEKKVENLAAGGDTIVKMTWDQNLVPPETVTVGGTSVKWHPCLLAEVSPHDGPAPSGSTGYPVRHDNNLAQRNIRVADASGDADADVAAGVVAGTAMDYDVTSVILDRSQLDDECRAFVGVADDDLTEAWVNAVDEQRVRPTAPLPRGGQTGVEPEQGETGAGSSGSEDRPGGLTVTVQQRARLTIDDADGNQLSVTAPEGTSFTCSGTGQLGRGPEAPDLDIEQYQGRKMLFLDGETDVIEIPTHLEKEEYVPLVVGLERPTAEPGCGSVKVTQRLSNGSLSTGYTLQG